MSLLHSVVIGERALSPVAAKPRRVPLVLISERARALSPVAAKPRRVPLSAGRFAPDDRQVLKKPAFSAGRWASLAARGAALAIALGSLSACGAAACAKQPITDPARALSARQYDATQVRSLRAEAKVDQRGHQGRVKGKVWMFVERPDRLRFDVMTQFGPALILTSDGTTFALSDLKENRFLTGPACERNIARLIGVSVSGEVVTEVLLGDVPELADSTQSISCSREGGYRVERLGKDGARQSIELALVQGAKEPPERQRTELRAVTFWNAAGKRLYRVRYEDYRATKQAAVRLPFTVRIEDFTNDSDVLLRFQTIDVNVAVPEGAFAQEPRAGLTREEVACD